jgi:D-3-phosphoglycerate dehydrogenase
VLDPVESLILDLLEWLGTTPRPYAEVMDAWRTSCPRLPVWEEANERGFLARHRVTGTGEFVTVSATGRAYLGQHRSPTSGSLIGLG